MEKAIAPILLVIDHFGSGGAQRQIVAIANCLVKSGKIVHIVNYYPQYDHHRSSVDERVLIHDLNKKGKLGVGIIVGLIQLLKKYRYQSALAFLDTPAFYLEMASLLSRKSTKIFFSERSAIELKPKGVLTGLKNKLHNVCYHLTSNSMVQSDTLKAHYGTEKVSYIPNIMSDQLFKLPIKVATKELATFIVISHTRPFKNFKYVAEALVAYQKRYQSPPPTVQWYGEIYPSAELDDIYHFLSANKLEKKLIFHGAVKNVNTIIQNASFLIHASQYESSANAVAEALAAATPVIVGNIPEHKVMIEKSNAGYLVDLKSAAELSEIMRKAENLSQDDYMRLCQKARSYAYTNHKSETVLAKYINLLGS